MGLHPLFPPHSYVPVGATLARASGGGEGRVGLGVRQGPPGGDRSPRQVLKEGTEEVELAWSAGKKIVPCNLFAHTGFQSFASSRCRCRTFPLDRNVLLLLGHRISANLNLNIRNIARKQTSCVLYSMCCVKNLTTWMAAGSATSCS